MHEPVDAIADPEREVQPLVTLARAEQMVAEEQDRWQALRLEAALEKALTVCRCAARVVDSPAYQGVSDEDCDLENAVRTWRTS